MSALHWQSKPPTQPAPCVLFRHSQEGSPSWHLTREGVNAQPFPKLHLALLPGRQLQDMGSPEPSTQTQRARCCLSCCPYCLFWVLQSPRKPTTVSWEARAGYGGEQRVGNEQDRWAGRGTQIKPGFLVHSRNGCSRLSANSAHMLLEAT